MNKNKVDVLFIGYSYQDEIEPERMRANCTCSLIRTVSGMNIIVDTMTAWDGKRITEALEEHHLRPENIDYVVCTHGHSDHIGCNYLFPKAKFHIVGACVSKEDIYHDFLSSGKEFPLEFNQVIVVNTPGHTLTCVSVLVHNTEYGCVGICGDLFERQEDIMDDSIWKGAGSENKNQQKLNRFKVAQLCTYIIPGHGPGFKISKEMLKKLKQDADNVNQIGQGEILK